MKKLLVFALLAAFLLLGCSPGQKTVEDPGTTPTPPAETTQPNPAEPTPEQPTPQPVEKLVKVTLYLPDKAGQYLVKVPREITVKDGAIVRAIIEELQKEGEYARTIPAEAKLLGANIKNGVVYLDFSKEFRDKHWGGSLGETITLYSIVNSLTELPGINSVQFYLEGKVEETILGHADWRKPFTRNEQILKK